jgi:hypothetical protein
MNTKMRRPEGVLFPAHFLIGSEGEQEVCMTDSVCFCRYSEILDYHNVETGGDNQVMQEFTNGQ